VKLRSLVLSLLAGLALPAVATAKPVTTADLKWYTPDADFEPVEPAPWVYDSVGKAFVEDWPNPATWPMVEKLVKSGVTVVHTAGPNPYFPLRKDGGEGGSPAQRADLAAIVKRLHGMGLRVVIGVSPYAPPDYVRQHPSWRLKSSADQPPLDTNLDLTKPENDGLRSLSLASPYGDYLIENLAEMFSDLDVDGISFDGNYHPMINFTPLEMELYQKETGRSFPAKIDLNDDDYKIYLLWADTKLENWYRRLHTRLRQVKPDAAVYTWTTNAGRYGHFLTSPRVMSARMNLLFDSPIQEWWLDESNLGASVVPAFGAAYVRAVTGGRTGASEPYVMSHGNPYSTSSFPRHELFVRCMMAMTNGSTTPIAVPSAAGPDSGELTLREIGKRKQWIVHTTPLPWAAILVSEQTRQFYAGGQVMERFLAHALGAFRVGLEEHFPMTLITDTDLTPQRLAPFSVLVLPNAAALSDRQIDVIRDYVKEGGGLVATCETSLTDELGHPRGNFALADLFSVDYQGRPAAPIARPAVDANFAIVIGDSYWANRQGAAELRWGAGDIQTSGLIDDPRMPDLVNGVQASFKGPMVRLGDIRPPGKRAMLLFPEAQQPITAMVTNEFGKGRVVYMAAALDAAYFSYGYPYQRVVFSRAVQWAARQPPPIRVKAPMCVQSTIFTQRGSDGGRWVIHLFNGLNSTSDHGLPEANVPLREEEVPVSGIEVSFRAIHPRRAHLEPGGDALQLLPGDDGVKVVLPPLPVHYMVVAEE
jgi:hypothetical protein